MTKTSTQPYDDDRALAAMCSAGDRAAQRALFEREKRHVHATLYRILGSNTDMDDLVQDTFLQVFRSVGSFRGDALLSTWIDRIAVRVAHAYIGRRRPAPTRLSVVPEPADDSPHAEQRSMDREAARRLYAMLERLDATQRIAFTLHVLDGRPLRTIAEAMDASLAVTKSRVWRAMRWVEARARRDPLLAAYLRVGSDATEVRS